MKTKLILPGMVALTFHAFLLFGLTGKTPPAIIEPEVKPPDLGHAVPIDQDDLVRASAKTDDEPSPSRGGPVAPRRDDIPVVSPPHGAFTIPALPPVKGEHTISVIPVGWENPAGPGRIQLLTRLIWAGWIVSRGRARNPRRTTPQICASTASKGRSWWNSWSIRRAMCTTPSSCGPAIRNSSSRRYTRSPGGNSSRVTAAGGKSDSA